MVDGPPVGEVGLKGRFYLPVLDYVFDDFFEAAGGVGFGFGCGTWVSGAALDCTVSTFQGAVLGVWCGKPAPVLPILKWGRLCNGSCHVTRVFSSVGPSVVASCCCNACI